MERILNFKTWILESDNEHNLSPSTSKWLSACSEGKWRMNKWTNRIDIDGNFDTKNNPLGFRGVNFGIIKGDFNCSHNNLTSLKGAPQKVEGVFNCSNNKLTSLEEAPQKVEGVFNCSNNKLISLKGAPQKSDWDFNCSENDLTSLEGAPQEVKGSFNCNGNYLISLDGAPQKVGINFYCISNELVSLKGAPQEIGGSFNCSKNDRISSEGVPEKIGGYFVFDTLKIRWNQENWDSILKNGPKKSRSLLIAILPFDKIVNWIKENPLDIDLLQEYPETKDKVLKELGVKDLSKLSKMIKDGMI